MWMIDLIDPIVDKHWMAELFENEEDLGPVWYLFFFQFLSFFGRNIESNAENMFGYPISVSVFY